MELPKHHIPIQKIDTINGVEIFIKREDQTHCEISGNKYWKLFYNVKNYLAKSVSQPMLITFGGAYSNHISAVASLGRDLGIPTIGIIRGEELQDKWQENYTLMKAYQDGMSFRFVSREAYRDKNTLSKVLLEEFPKALIIPEGGTNPLAVEGIQHMLSNETKTFDYLCAAVGTGGTLAGISKFADPYQKILGFKVVNDTSIYETIVELSGKENFQLFEAHDGKYGKISDENIHFLNTFFEKYHIPADPIYVGKMLRKLFSLVEEGFFPEKTRVLAFHTGGLQGIIGANHYLAERGKTLLKIDVE